MGPRAAQRAAVDLDVELLVVEGDHPGDRQQLAGREVIGPGQVLMFAADGPAVGARVECDRPVSAGYPLVRAGRPGLAGYQVSEVDVGAVDVVAGRQPS